MQVPSDRWSIPLYLLASNAFVPFSKFEEAVRCFLKIFLKPYVHTEM